MITFETALHIKNIFQAYFANPVFLFELGLSHTHPIIKRALLLNQVMSCNIKLTNMIFHKNVSISINSKYISYIEQYLLQ